MKAHGLRIKKSLGQNFLIDRNILAKIVQAAEIGPGDLVLEIGPGIGALTQALAEAGAKVIAVEIDRQLVQVLHHTLAGYDQVQIVHGDALAMPLAGLMPGGVPSRVVANLPYYITSPLLLKLYEEQLPMQTAVVMVQREVAERIVANPGSRDYGALTLALAYRAKAEIITIARRTVFLPPPTVDSAVVRLRTRPFPHPAAGPRVFSAVVRAAFGQRRKTLANALKVAVDDTVAVLDAAGIDGRRRGETLTPAEFGRLSLAAASHLKD
jgi:16S rRNA (adenine1518-N6/adenine1519-N6)-dimethyltransferase